MSTTTTYELGDLLLIVFPEMYRTNQVYLIYKSYDSDTDSVTGYTVDRDGLSLAKKDNDEEEDLIHRSKEYTISKFSKAQVYLIENPYLTLDSAQQLYYDQIQSRL